MKYPYMLIMRNNPNGCIWQAYTVCNEIEEKILTNNAKLNWFIVEKELCGYTNETSPGWRNSPEWKKCLEKNTQKEKV